jgi:hypothetical protein
LAFRISARTWSKMVCIWPGRRQSQ